MKLLIVCLLALAAVVAIQGQGQETDFMLPPFLNCDGTGIPGWNAFKGIQGFPAELGRKFYHALGSMSTLTRVCCVSQELPNGCECFDSSPLGDFFNLFGVIKPLCPAEMGVKFFFYSKANNKPITIKAYDNSIQDTDFDPVKPTKIIVHGWGDFPYHPDYIKMREAVMAAGDYNIILVDWASAAGHWDRNIFQSFANVRSVGAMLAHLISTLKRHHEMSLQDVHMICSHLGAQVCGAAGKEIKRLEHEKVGRISVADAVGVSFEGQSTNVRLDKSDADFVDVIHCDAGPDGSFGLGMTMSFGHVDFQANGGAFQPGCPQTNYGYLDIVLQKPGSLAGACSHYRCNQLFISSINTCPYKDPKNPDCQMGWHATHACEGDIVINTAPKAPFCEVER